MLDLGKYLYEKIKPILNEWDETGIYAISFFVYSNEAFTYQNYSNISEFYLSYATDSGFKGDGFDDDPELKWYDIYWKCMPIYIINPHEENDEGVKTLFQWYKENGIENIGFESHDNKDNYDKNMRYIGKGPVGYYELLTVVSNVAMRLQLEGFIAEKFGAIPIIVHDYEQSWYVEEATERANPNGEAEVYLKILKEDSAEIE